MLKKCLTLYWQCLSGLNYNGNGFTLFSYECLFNFSAYLILKLNEIIKSSVYKDLISYQFVWIYKEIIWINVEVGYHKNNQEHFLNIQKFV